LRRPQRGLFAWRRRLEVPLDPTIRESSDAGTPITVAEPDTPRAGFLPYGGSALGTSRRRSR
jgi:hypothetical protein